MKPKMSACSLPWSKASLHEIRNPFTRLEEAKKQHAPNPLKKSKSARFKVQRTSTFSLLLKSGAETKRLKEETESQDTTDKTPEDLNNGEASSSWADPKGNDLELRFSRISPYQHNLTKELLDNFGVLAKFEALPDSEVLKRGFNVPRTKERESQITLLLDLDETLVHMVREPELKQLSKEARERLNRVEILNNGEITQINIIIRPYLSVFLSIISQHYDISVFSSRTNLIAFYGQRI